MRRLLLTVSLALAAAGPCWAWTLYVTTTADGGPGSLRWAIDRANAHDGPDRILFHPSIAPARIKLRTELPALVDGETTINGDVDGDGDPDIELNGAALKSGVGLRLVAHPDPVGCTIRGLAIVNSPENGIYLRDSCQNTVSGCHVGVGRYGLAARRNGQSDIRLRGSHANTIGGPAPADRNVLSGSADSSGMALFGSHGNKIVGNYFGVKRDGSGAFGDMEDGLDLEDSRANAIGGTSVGSGNIFGGVRNHALNLRGNCRRNEIRGNYFGLAPDGDTVLSIGANCIGLENGAKSNTIGGTSIAARNVFAGDARWAVSFRDAGTQGNKVKGNYFGTNATGTRKRALRAGVGVLTGAGRQVIGGATARAGNYFCCTSGPGPEAVALSDAGADTLIQHNRFGIRPDGRNAPGMMLGVSCVGVRGYILDNTFLGQSYAIACSELGTSARVHGNMFRGCMCAVFVTAGARCSLGNLTNARTDDDGGNYFRASNTWFVSNLTSNRIKAEGNDFGTTSRREIDAKIRDRRDDDSYGRVDFNPLMGGVIPTGSSVPVTLTALTAVPTEAGAQITFSLSAAADVQARVLNIAGRPVKTLCHAKDCDAGTNTLLWSAQSDRGLAVPNGTYLVEVTAKAADGVRARALAQVRVRR